MDDVRVLARHGRLAAHHAALHAGDGRRAAARRVEQTVYDMAYLQRLNRYAGDEPLRYEKHMLDEWFDAQFGSAAAK